MGRTSEAVEFLDGLALRPHQACAWLSTLVCRINAMALFHQYYPREFRPHAQVCLRNTEALAHALDKFFGLLSRRFPLHYGEWEDEELDLDWVCHRLPVYPEAEIWHDWSPEHIPLPILGALVIEGIYPRVPQLAGWAQQGDGWQRDKLEALCAKQRTPLRWAYLAVEMSLHDTGNDWLDVTMQKCDGNGVEMSAEMIDFLTSEWRAAEAIQRKVSKLHDWLERDRARLQKLQRLLLVARVSLTKEQGRIRLTTNGALVLEERPLVEVLAPALDAPDWDEEDDE